jgi:hypothetical protein
MRLRSLEIRDTLPFHRSRIAASVDGPYAEPRKRRVQARTDAAQDSSCPLPPMALACRTPASTRCPPTASGHRGIQGHWRTRSLAKWPLSIADLESGRGGGHPRPAVPNPARLDLRQARNRLSLLESVRNCCYRHGGRELCRAATSAFDRGSIDAHPGICPGGDGRACLSNAGSELGTDGPGDASRRSDAGRLSGNGEAGEFLGQYLLGALLRRSTGRRARLCSGAIGRAADGAARPACGSGSSEPCSRATAAAGHRSAASSASLQSFPDLIFASR